MDAVELARLTAAELHREAVARGADPWSPYEFACSEAHEREYDVEGAAPGAAILNGARACLIAKDALIVHETAGSVFDRAFLVAHELGHLVLGDEREVAETRQVNPGRAAEAAPIGLERVVDYGPRQRREVQMDIFAREFLLPRDVAKRLHVEEGRSASDIAIKLGAPFEVVAQQLLDALLLPTMNEASEEDSAPTDRNEEQIDAAAHRGVGFLLEAGPGTGKTKTLASRVHGLIEEGIDPRRILVLTFSNRAAQEMTQRISKGHTEAGTSIWIGTFHAFGLDVVRRFYEELGVDPNPGLLDRTRALELLEDEFASIDLTHYRNLYDPTQTIADVLSAISRAKDEIVCPQGYAALASAMLTAAKTPEATIAAEKAVEIARVYAVYERLKKDARSVDFGDLVMLPVQLLEKNAAVREHFQNLYDHILVDEYQDVNRSSVRLLSALKPNGENLWAVGDARQSIYRFRGASSHNMGLFRDHDFPGSTGSRLAKNYRSTPEVVDAFGAFGESMAGTRGGRLCPDRASAGHPAEFRSVEHPNQQTPAIAEAIEELRNGGLRYRDQAVLCTGNDRLATIGQELESLGIPVLFLGSLFERPEIRDLLAYLTLLIDHRAAGLLRIGSRPEFSMNLDDVSRIIDRLRKLERTTSGVQGARWFEKVDDFDDVSSAGKEVVHRLAANLSGFDAQSHPWQVLASFLLDQTRACAELSRSESSISKSQGIAIWQFMNFARTEHGYGGMRIAGFLRHVRRLVRLADERDLRHLPLAAQGIDAVRLMTVHGAKGLEFKGVHLPGLNGDTLPRSFRTPTCLPPDGMVAGANADSAAELKASHEEEQACLFYVATSRARTG